MSSGSWQNVAVEDNWSTFDFREAPFRRRAICHSSPASDIYADSMVPRVASIHTESYKNNICFVKKKNPKQGLRRDGESACGTILNVTYGFPLPVLCGVLHWLYVEQDSQINVLSNRGVTDVVLGKRLSDALTHWRSCLENDSLLNIT